MMSIIINGDSMIPFLKPMAEVKFKSVPANVVRIGDIVTYYEKNSHIMVIHRVIRKNKNGYLVKGDNNWHVDPVILTSKELLVLKEVSYKNRIMKTDTAYGNIVNKLFLCLSLLRLFPLIHRRRLREKQVVDERMEQ